MDIYQLRTFVVVAREGTVTRASEVLHLSQPAVSAHIKAIEEGLGVSLFHRTARGMSLTTDGQRLLSKAEKTLAAHQELLDEAGRNKTHLVGKLRLGAGTNSNNEAIGKLLTSLSERHPDVEVALKHGTSVEVLAGIRNGSLDAGFYNDPGEPDRDLTVIEVSRFKVFVVAAPGFVPKVSPLNWNALAELPWIYPAASACCGRTADALFKTHRFKPKRIVSVDRQDMTQTLIAGGLGVGLLHENTAHAASLRGEVELLFEADTVVRIFFAYLAERERDPLLAAAGTIVNQH